MIMRRLKNQYHKDTCFKDIGQCIYVLLTPTQSIMNMIGRNFVSNEGFNKTCAYDYHNLNEQKSDFVDDSL